MDGQDESRARQRALTESDTPVSSQAVGDQAFKALIEAFIRLARGDFSVRIARNFTRDTNDTLAYFVNMIAEELSRLVGELERRHQALTEGVQALSESFLALAAGDFRAHAPRTGSGDPLDVLSFLMNNTAAEVGAAFSELEQQRSLLESTLESMIDGVILLDSAGVVQRVNGAMARLLDCRPEELSGKALAELVATSSLELAAHLPNTLAAGDLTSHEVVFRCNTGGTAALIVNASAHRDGKGELIGCVMVVRDERELRAAQTQLQLTDRLATMGTLAAGVAHEINNPLTYMMGNLEFLAEELPLMKTPEGPEAAPLDELLEAISSTYAGAERVRRIVADLKVLSRGDQEPPSPVELNPLLDSAANMMRNELRHHARLERDNGPVPLVMASEPKLMQVFLNLLQNAAQAIPLGDADHHVVRILTYTDDAGCAVVEISDTGQGIDESHKSRLFDAFFTTKAGVGGTGLGLSICHKIVAGMGGEIQVISELGQGATFRVVLPSTTVAAAQSSGSPDADSVGVRGRSVLVIDDEPEVGATVRRMLGRDHAVTVVTRASSALDLLEAQGFDLILCDVMMPEMTGIELYRALQAQDSELAETLVFMTGGTFGTGVEEFLAGVGNARIDKPFMKRELVDLFDRASRRRR